MWPIATKQHLGQARICRPPDLGPAEGERRQISASPTRRFPAFTEDPATEPLIG